MAQLVTSAFPTNTTAEGPVSRVTGPALSARLAPLPTALLVLPEKSSSSGLAWAVLQTNIKWMKLPVRSATPLVSTAPGLLPASVRPVPPPVSSLGLLVSSVPLASI